MSGICADITREIRLRILLGLILFCGRALPLLGQAPPAQDTFVSQTKANTNYGGNASLAVLAGNTSLVQFNVSPLPSGVSASQLNKATLRVFVSGLSNAGSFDVVLVNGKRLGRLCAPFEGAGRDVARDSSSRANSVSESVLQPTQAVFP